MALTAVCSKAMVLLLMLIRCCYSHCGYSVVVLCFVVRYFMSILVCNHLEGEERAGCFALFVFLVSCDCCVALLHVPRVCLQSVIVVFPDHTHLLFW